MPDQRSPAVLRSAIEHRDAETAVAAATRLQSASLTERLDRLATALREERYADAEVQFQALADQYERQRATDRQQVATARRAQTIERVSLDQQQTLAEHTRTVTATQAKRAQVLAQAGELIVNRGDSDQQPSAVADTVETARSQEQTREQRQTSAQSVTDGVTVPATLAIRTFTLAPERIASGETTTVTVGLGNAGDQPATQVTATVTTPSGAPADLSYGELQPGVTAERSVDLTPEGTGTRTVALEATATETSPVSANETLVLTPFGPGTLPGQDAPATDPDGDGIYEDITGDNVFDVRDVAALLERFDDIDPAKAEFIDLNGDGVVNILDVAELLAET